jgi:hypothetical protein
VENSRLNDWSKPVKNLPKGTVKHSCTQACSKTPRRNDGQIVVKQWSNTAGGGRLAEDPRLRRLPLRGEGLGAYRSLTTGQRVSLQLDRLARGLAPAGSRYRSNAGQILVKRLPASPWAYRRLPIL